MLVLAITPSYQNQGSIAESVTQIDKQDVHETVAPVAIVEQPQPTEPTVIPVAIPVSQPRTRQQAEANVTHNPTGCSIYRPLVEQYAWDVNVAMAIMQAESGCNPNARNPEAHKDRRGNVICHGSFGLFQISCHGGQLFDPAANVAAAWAKYQARGWKPWGAYTNKSFLRYL